MAILSKGTDFSTGDQVTAANLDALVDSATFASGAVDGVTTSLDSSSPQKIIVKNGGIGTNQLATSDSTTTGVTFAKMQHVAANTVLVRDASSAGDISAKAVANTQILIGDGTGFTAAALSGDVTMTNAGAVTIADDAVDTAQIADDAVNTARIDDNAVTTAKIANSSNTTTGVTFAKMQHVPANTVLVRDASSEGDISAKAVTNQQILIGDGTGFTAAALSGDATMTNAGVVDISNDVALGGNPTATTQSAGNNSTRVATTAFVTAAVAASTTSPFNSLRLMLLPSDFEEGATGSAQYKIATPRSACTRIPLGYKVTHFTYSTDTTNNTVLTVNEQSISDSSATQKGTKSAKGSNLVVDIDDVTGSDTNYLSVTLTGDNLNSSQNRDYFGGYFTLVAV